MLSVVSFHDLHTELLSLARSNKKPASEKNREAGFLFPKLSSPAVIFRFAEFRPEALRPYLSISLPFSESVSFERFG